MRIAYLNKRFVPLEKASVSILDRGFLYGDGAFETIRSYRGMPFLAEKHIERLFKTLAYLQIRPKAGRKKIKEIVCELLNVNKLENAYIKIIITRGVSSGMLLPSGNTSPTLAIYALPGKPLSGNFYKNGVRITISESGLNENSLIGGNKTLNYLENIMGRVEAKRKKSYDAVFLNTKGFVSEATASNIFLVRKGKLYTPNTRSGILPGVTREAVIGLAYRELKLKAAEKDIKKEDLFDADEVFLTNSLIEILPVVKVDGRVIGRGKPDVITKNLMGLFKEAVSIYCRKKGICEK